MPFFYVDFWNYFFITCNAHIIIIMYIVTFLTSGLLLTKKNICLLMFKNVENIQKNICTRVEKFYGQNKLRALS